SDQQQLDKAIPLLEKLAKLQPKYRLQAAQGLVPLYFKNKQEDKALEIVNQILGENPTDVNMFYMMGNLLQQNGKYDEAKKGYEKVQAFQELKQNAKTEAGATNDIVKQLEEVARGYSARALPAARDRAWEATRLLVAHYLTEKQLDKAGELLEAVRKGGFEETDWYNAALYVAQQREDYDGMIQLYDRVQQREPSKARDIAVAKTMTCIIAKKSDEAAKDIRELNQQRLPPGM